MADTPLPGDEGPVYQCAPGITWLRDADHMLLVEEERGQSWLMRGTQAAVWDFLTLAYPYQKIVRFLSLLLRVPIEEAEVTLLCLLCDWQAAGILQLTEQGKRGQSGD
jgi:hypothetical protein